MDEHDQQAKRDAAPRDSRLQYGIASLLLITTLVAVLLAVFRWVPGLGIFLIVVLTPPLVRTTVVAVREKRLGRRLTIAQKVIAFLAGLGLVTTTALASGLAFYITCWCGFLLGMAATGGQLSNLGFALVIGFVFGAIAQIVCLVYFIRWLWRRRGEQRNRLGDIGFILSWAGFAMIYGVATLQLADKNRFGNDGYWSGLIAIPGLVIGLIALCRPRRAMASVGTGLALAACVVTPVYFNATKHGLRGRTPDSLTLLGCAMAIGVMLAIAVPLIVWWRFREQPAEEVKHETSPSDLV